MTNHGDDCYFFYYSFCTKGDGCPFRHCEAAMGSETVCSLWEEGRCFRTGCKFRHMEILKNRKEIPCYWEKQPAGCQKPHCAFFHEKPRYNEGPFIAPNKSVNWMEEQQQQQQEEAVPPPPAPLPTAANPQFRGVIKTDTQELVPSPTHPPVVINPADDDEDEDDQFSEGEDSRLGPSPRKLHKSDDSLNLGVSTLEEIRLRRALKASMKRSGYPIQSADAPANGEKENMQSLFRPALYESRDDPSLVFEETGRPRGSVSGRLGRKIPNSDVKREGLLKRSLAQRLGRVVDVQLPSEPQKALKPVKERLGLFSSGHAAPAEPADTSEAPQKVPEQIHIKTLEEIKQEKASKVQHQRQSGAALRPTSEITVTRTNTTRVPKESKRSVTVKDSSISNVKTFSEILRAKRKRQEEEQTQSSSPKKSWHAAESQEPSDTEAPPQEKTDTEEVRVKTLEEIRREKASRQQVQQAAEADGKKCSDYEEDTAKRPRLLRLQKPAGQSKVLSGKTAEEPAMPVKPAAAASETGTTVKVKSFEEIMREKRLRKQEQEEQTKGAADEESPQNGTPPAPLKRKLPAKVSLSPASSSSAPVLDSTHKLPAQKPALKSKSASLSAAAPAAVASVPVKLNSSPQTSNTKSHSKNLRSSAQPRAAPQAPPTEAPDRTSSKNSGDTKVRPKLNVKPSVMKPAVQLKPAQKRKGAERSAVAAVKPLNSSSAVQETPCTDSLVLPPFNAEAQLSSAPPHSPTSLLDASSTSSPQREESQPAAGEAATVHQGPVLKSPTQPKSRRLSTAASRSTTSAAAASSSAVDDFDDLINEFTDDHLEEDVDPGIGEDDLLQELSEMIDS